ncbi:potassium channel family protein [Leisingera sp. XS_AS12]|uniref:potassium channel family protein n=1 Tax=Leisingera sp. XS_AS12 TaxID=3241294 RepID=UPI00351276DF
MKYYENNFRKLGEGMINQLVLRLYVMAAEMRWQVLLAMFSIHAAFTWAGLWLAGEGHLTPAVEFIYYYMVSISTFGYGDLSPLTSWGKMVVALWLVPGSLTITPLMLAKVGIAFAQIWRKRMNGNGDYSDVQGATVLIGYHPVRTRKMIDEIKAGNKRCGPLILVARQDVNIDHSQISFVRAESLSSKEDLLRAGVQNARNVLVYADNDDMTLAAGMAVAALNEDLHLVAHFDDEEKAELLRAHTGAVCEVSQSVGILVREVQDPGSAEALTDLSSAQVNSTIFALDAGALKITAGEAKAAFDRLGAVFVGTRCREQKAHVFHLPDDHDLTGMQLHYIASERIGFQAFQQSLGRLPAAA